MLPSKRVYFLLILGIAIAPTLTLFTSIWASLFITLLFDVIVLGLMVVDGLQVRQHRVQMTREIPSRLSIGRENPVLLKVTSGKANAMIQIRDDYPSSFGVSVPALRATVPSHTTQELTYTVHPTQRGEFSWGDIQVRQLGAWGLAWDDRKIFHSLKVKVYPDLVGLRSPALSTRTNELVSHSNDTSCR